MKTILLVDDDPDVLSSLEVILARPEYAIIAMSGAEPALSAIQEEARIDLVVTDYSMPGMDTREYFSRLKQALPSVPVIVLTGHSSVTTGITSPGIVPFEIINKPVEPKELCRIVKSALDSFAATGRPTS
jgi:two-component system response regulator GlrR